MTLRPLSVCDLTAEYPNRVFTDCQGNLWGTEVVQVREGVCPGGVRTLGLARLGAARERPANQVLVVPGSGVRAGCRRERAAYIYRVMVAALLRNKRELLRLH